MLHAELGDPSEQGREGEGEPLAIGLDPRASRALFDDHCDFVARLVRRFGGPAIDHDAAVQDVFLVVFRELPRFEGRAQLRTWIYRICMHVAAEHRRRLSRRERLRQALSVLAFWRQPAAPPSEALERRDDVARLSAALGQLSERKRAAFVLCELEELTSEEAALVLGVPPATVRTRLHHARRELREHFATLRGEP